MLLSLEANRQMYTMSYCTISSPQQASVEDVFVGHICLLCDLCGSSGKVYYFCAVITVLAGRSRVQYEEIRVFNGIQGFGTRWRLLELSGSGIA